jgi:hypothetical protein
VTGRRAGVLDTGPLVSFLSLVCGAKYLHGLEQWKRL